MNQLLEKHKLSQSTKHGIHHVTNALSIKQTEFVIFELPEKESPGLDGFTKELYLIFKEEFNLFQEIEEEEIVPN